MATANQDINPVPSYDAQQQAEDIAQGDQPAPKVDVDSDYEASKAYSQSEVDQQGQGAEAAEAATHSKMEPHSPEETVLKEPETGSSDPEAYRAMAQEITSQTGQFSQ
jgi:hypothetical protein